MLRSFRTGPLPVDGLVALLALVSPALVSPVSGQHTPAPTSVDPMGRVWHPHEFVFATGEVGAAGAPLDEAPPEPFNPWLNWRLNARFRSPSGDLFDVPGFYAGDAAGSGVGDAWKVRFAPDEPGVWRLIPTLEYASTPLNVAPLDVPDEIVRFDIWAMVAASAVLLVFARTGWQITRREGWVMLAGYAAYLAVQVAAL